jgi:hypothetical protein
MDQLELALSEVVSRLSWLWRKEHPELFRNRFLKLLRNPLQSFDVFSPHIQKFITFLKYRSFDLLPNKILKSYQS